MYCADTVYQSDVDDVQAPAAKGDAARDLEAGEAEDPERFWGEGSGVDAHGVELPEVQAESPENAVSQKGLALPADSGLASLQSVSFSPIPSKPCCGLRERCRNSIST